MVVGAGGAGQGDDPRRGMANGCPAAVLLTAVLVGMNAASPNYLALGCFFFFLIAPAKWVLASDMLLYQFPAELSYYFLIKKSPRFVTLIFL